MNGMIEVSRSYFIKNIHELNVKYEPFKNRGEWRLHGILIAETFPGYETYGEDGIRKQKKYFVIPQYAPKPTE